MTEVEVTQKLSEVEAGIAEAEAEALKCEVEARRLRNEVRAGLKLERTELRAMLIESRSIATAAASAQATKVAIEQEDERKNAFESKMKELDELISLAKKSPEAAAKM